MRKNLLNYYINNYDLKLICELKEEYKQKKI